MYLWKKIQVNRIVGGNGLSEYVDHNLMYKNCENA